MSNIVTGQVTGLVDNTDVLQGEADIRREVAKEAADTNAHSTNLAWGVSDKVLSSADRAESGFDRVTGLQSQYFIASQSNDFSNATALAGMKAAVDLSFAKTQADIQLAGFQSAAAATLAGEKNAAAMALGQAMIGQQIINDGAATRQLINQLKTDDLNRFLIERNTELVDSRSEGRYLHAGATNSQFAAVSSQLNAMASNLQETRQGINNFGTMSGSAGTQASTNNVA